MKNKQKILIKKANASHARRISYLIRRNTEEVAENYYTKKQKEAWNKANTPHQILKQMKSRALYCAFDNDILKGTVALCENEILGFYVSYTSRGKGIGKKLYAHMEQIVRESHFDKIKLTSTRAGLPFYESLGFVQIKPVVVKINNVDFHEYLMVKKLS